MSRPVISVLMPLYNAEDTVQTAISSLLKQTFHAFEIIAVDDGSTDDTAVAVLKSAGDDKRLRLIQRDHAGLIPTLNAGLDQCQGELVARMDGDDICHPDRLRLQVELMSSQPSVSVCSSLIRSFPRSVVKGGFLRYEKWLNSLLTHEQITRDIFVESPIAHPSAMMRTEELREIGGYQERGWPEDYDLWLRYFLAGKRFSKVKSTLLFWREHRTRLTFTDSRYSLENFIRAKAHYITIWLGLRHEVILWGAGMTGRRLSKHLVREGLHIACVIDIDPKKIGRTMRSIPIVPPEELDNHPSLPVITAVGSENARQLIRDYLLNSGRLEMKDFICAA